MRVPGYEFTIRYRGLSVGTLRVAVCRWAGMSQHPTADSLVNVEEFYALGFDPEAGYAAIQPVVRRAGTAVERLGFLGRAGDRTSWDSGWMAEAAAHALWEELEVLGVGGHRIPWRVACFYELVPRGEPYYRVELSREDAGAAVPAALPLPRADGADVRRVLTSCQPTTRPHATQDRR